MITNAVMSIAGTAAGVALGAQVGGAMAGTAAMLGGQIGGQAGSQISSFISSLAPVKQISKSTTTGVTMTEENKAVTDMLVMLDEALKKMNEYDSYGLWNVAGYFTMLLIGFAIPMIGNIICDFTIKEEIVKIKESYTGLYLKNVLKKDK